MSGRDLLLVGGAVVGLSGAAYLIRTGEKFEKTGLVELEAGEKYQIKIAYQKSGVHSDGVFRTGGVLAAVESLERILGADPKKVKVPSNDPLSGESVVEMEVGTTASFDLPQSIDTRTDGPASQSSPPVSVYTVRAVRRMLNLLG